jgi:hypothetical protein
MPIYSESNSNASASEDKKVEESFTLSVYIDFSYEVKKRTGWRLLPDGTVYNQENLKGGRHIEFDYVEVLNFTQNRIIKDLERELRLLLKNDTIKVEFTETRIGSLEVLITIYAIYASINDFIETTKLIRNFVDRYVNANLSNRFGSVFTTQTTFVTPIPTQPGFNINSLMTRITILISVSTFGVLSYFSYEFISNIIIKIVPIALFLTLIIELSKVTTTYYIVYEGIKNNSSNKLVIAFNQMIRILAILLSTIFCLSQISQVNTAPNLDDIKNAKLNEINNAFTVEYERLEKTAKTENEILEGQLGDVDKPTTIRRNSTIEYADVRINNESLNKRISANNKNKEDKIQALKQKTENDKNTMLNNLSQNADVNNKRINTILATVFDVQSNNPNYAYWYRIFVIFSSLFITVLVELISYISIVSLSRGLIK